MEKKSTFEGKSVKGIANYYLTHTDMSKYKSLLYYTKIENVMNITKV